MVLTLCVNCLLKLSDAHELGSFAFRSRTIVACFFISFPVFGRAIRTSMQLPCVRLFLRIDFSIFDNKEWPQDWMP